MPRSSPALRPLLVAASLAACGSPEPGEPDPPTFTELYQDVFAQGCTAVGHCHAGMVTGFLNFETREQAYASLVDAPATGSHCGLRGLTLVVPGSPEQSLLVAKVEGSAECGSRMPNADRPLAERDIAKIRAWIRAGAADD